METRGFLAPEDAAAAREQWAALAGAAKTVTREVARALAVEDYGERVTDEVVAATHDAIFASLLEVHVGDRAAFEDATADLGYETVEVGSPNVDRVAWHVARPAETVLATTFADDADAAVATLRRQAHGRVYRDLLGDRTL